MARMVLDELAGVVCGISLSSKRDEIGPVVPRVVTLVHANSYNLYHPGFHSRYFLATFLLEHPAEDIEH